MIPAMNDVAGRARHTPMMQPGLYRVKYLSFFTNVSQCVSQVRNARRSTSFCSSARYDLRGGCRD